jgi:hypothetical protein
MPVISQALISVKCCKLKSTVSADNVDTLLDEAKRGVDLLATDMGLSELAIAV